MKTVYFDQTSVDGCMAVFSSTAKVVPAGTAINAMPVKYRDETYMQLEEKLDIRFIFKDTVPDVPFYAVPYVEVVAFDHFGGFLAVQDEGPLLYIDREWNCFYVAPEVRSLLTLESNWREAMVPYPGLRLFSSREAAMVELEFIEIET